MFILISSSDQNLVLKQIKSSSLPIQTKVIENNESETWLFQSEINSELQSLIRMSCINDLKDYSLNDIKNNLLSNTDNPDSRTIFSLAFNTDDRFVCISDKWGLFPFYYYKKNNQFILSDNLFLIANLVNPSYNEEALFETLFFGKPKNSNTYFSDIFTTIREQRIVFTYSTGEISISSSNDLYGLLNTVSSENPAEKYNEIVKTSRFLPDCHISLSAGSDSNTLLSVLLYNKCKPVCHSWGNDKYLELQLIRKNIDRLGLEWSITSFEGMYDNYIENNRKNAFLTNGNNHTLHHAQYYSCNTNINLFEGYLGSEFTKGELSDGMYTPVMKDILTGARTMKDALRIHFKELKPETYLRFEQFILNNYEKEITNINTIEGFEGYKKHLFTFLPASVFSPIVNLAIDKGIKLYWPNLDIEFLRAVYSTGYGLMHTASLRNDYSAQKALHTLYLINKFSNSLSLGTTLDRNVSFKDVSKSASYYKVIKKLNILRKKIRYYNQDLILEQVDYREEKNYESTYLTRNTNSWLLERLSGIPSKINSASITRTIIQYEIINDISQNI